MKNNGKLANNLFFLSLLCIFVICSVLVVSYQIIGYRNIVDSNHQVDEMHTPLSYISNKIRANDVQNSISVQQGEESDILLIEGNESITYIYMYNHQLRELHASKNYEVNLSDGDALFDIDSFTISKKDNQLTFQIGMQNEIKTLILTLHSEGGTL